jgi:hypothetical protein
MRNFILFLIFFASLPVCARDVYKSTNTEGEVIYSDTYIDGAERIRVPDEKSPSSTDSGTAGEDAAGRTAALGESGYTSFEIVQPENGATIRNNEGTVTVGLDLSPSLSEGHAIKILVDGSELEGEIRATQFSLNNLNRGTHSLVTRIVDADGNDVISSNSITFHLRKASINEP